MKDTDMASGSGGWRSRLIAQRKATIETCARFRSRRRRTFETSGRRISRRPVAVATNSRGHVFVITAAPIRGCLNSTEAANSSRNRHGYYGFEFAHSVRR